jgi:hypothetical protein
VVLPVDHIPEPPVTPTPIDRGETLRLVFEFYSDEAGTIAQDITGSVFVLINSNFPVPPTFTVTDAVNGKALLYLADTNTDDLVAGRNYEFQIKQTHGVSNNGFTVGDVEIHPVMVFYAK